MQEIEKKLLKLKMMLKPKLKCFRRTQQMKKRFYQMTWKMWK